MTFKHALTREAAYQSLLSSTRQAAHQQIARVLAERFPEMVATQPELLAHHYTEARLYEQAIPHWHQAGQHAIERSAHAEAISHLTKALELLQTFPDTPERTQHELNLQVSLSVPLILTRGYTAPEVETACARASCASRSATLRTSFSLCTAYTAFTWCAGDSTPRVSWQNISSASLGTRQTPRCR